MESYNFESHLHKNNTCFCLSLHFVCSLSLSLGLSVSLIVHQLSIVLSQSHFFFSSCLIGNSILNMSSNGMCTYTGYKNSFHFFFFLPIWFSILTQPSFSRFEGDIIFFSLLNNFHRPRIESTYIFLISPPPLTLSSF